ncbi:hemerythrin domain-containing protein [Gracilibacillus dipsosauri]|uniref:hemerythrin domain-containing protein n=1 Tax=Gracilibacillus dipsosauri TaxID=178340 RepID=UPI002409D96D
MKRHEALNPLSHHHHHALLMAVEMKKAGTKDNKKKYKELIRELIEFWEGDEEDHFRDEEETLYPLYLVHAENANTELVKEVLYQHAQIRGLVHSLRENQQTSYDKMQQLGNLLEKHVRLEERELFPLIEQAVPEKYLYQANGKFHRDSYSGY